MRARGLVAIGIVLGALGETGNAQSSLLKVNPLGRERNGWRLYSASASFGYSTLALPGSTSLPAFSLERLESDYDGTAAASFGYNYTGQNHSVSLLYSPSYVRRVRFSELKAFNQSISAKVTRRLAPRWDFAVAAEATDSTLDQLLFSPAILSSATTPSATLDDLIQAARAGQYSSDQLASILTGSPYVATPSRSVVYGSSLFSTSLHSSVTFRSSPRLSFSFGGGVARSQTRNDSQRDLQGQLNYLIPRNTSEQASASVSYGIDARTQIGAQGSTTIINSSLSRYATSNVNMFLNRNLTRHWFAGVAAGVGFASQLGESRQELFPGEPYSVQGNLGYTVREHSLIGSYLRSVSDVYGFGSSNSETAAGSWQWRPSGAMWTFYAASGWQRMKGGILGDVSYAYGNAGVARALSRQFWVNMTYAYVHRPAGAGDLSGALRQNLSGYSARVTLVWVPQGQEVQGIPVGGPAGGVGVTGPNR